MPLMAILIMLAALLYTVSIWSDKLSKTGLRLWMVVIFGTAFACDLIGTALMGQTAEAIKLNIHSISGYLALLIMSLHFFWAIMATLKQGKWKTKFHQCSIFAWLFWLMPFGSGLLLNLK